VRIRASKLRGITSYGLLVKAPEGSKVGDDVAELLQVQHWEPEIDIGYGITGGEVAKAPSGVFYTYDVDSFQRWGREVFVENEPVSVTEKINGCNGRYVYKDGIFHCGSRGEWKKEFPSKPTITLDDLVKQYNGDAAKAQNAYRKIENWKPQRNLWWIAADNTPTIKDFCIANPNFAIYGEVYGAVGGWTYNVKGKYQFMAFDILSPDGKWLDFPDFLALCRQFNVPTVPIIHEQIPFNFEEMVQMAEGNSVIDPGQIKEGIVLAPIKNRWDERLGRVKLKVINSAY
jgi:RNA ligase (TIGR02306 family)